jgi:hypothetical protein
MDWSLITSAVTAVGVSSVTTVLLQTLLTRRVEHHFERELERYKADLEVSVHAKQAVAQRRLDAYPKLVELCYRIKNMARLVMDDRASTLIQEFVGRVKELENMVFVYRADLEQGDLFFYVHQYKNLAVEFYRTAADLEPEAKIETLTSKDDKLALVFALLDRSHDEVVQHLTRDVQPAAPGSSPKPAGLLGRAAALTPSSRP